MVAGDAEVALTPPSKGGKASRSHPYRKTRSQNKDLRTHKQPSGGIKAEEDGLKREKLPTLSASAADDPSAPAAAAAATNTDDQIETAKPTAATDDVNNNSQDTAAEATDKTDTPSTDANDTNKNNKQDLDLNNNADTTHPFNPTVFRSATSTLQDTLALMNAKAATRVNISCDDLDVVYKQFEVFISSHPTLGTAVGPMWKTVDGGRGSGSPGTTTAPAPLSGTGDGSGGSADGGIAGIAANLSSMLTDLEQNVLAAAAAAGSDGDGVHGGGVIDNVGTGGGTQFPSTSTMPPLRAGWNAASLLHLPPGLASVLANRTKHSPTDAAAATTTTTITTGGGAETSILQEKLRKAIAAAQGGYTNKHNNNTTSYNDRNNNITGGAATYNPRMSSHSQPELQQLYNHSSLPQMYHTQQTSLTSGSPEYYQPSAADSAAIAAATAAALAGHSRAGQDKAPALELLRALSKINNAEYTSGEGGVHTYTTMNTTNNINNKLFSQQQHYFSPRSFSDEPSEYDPGDLVDDDFNQEEQERRSPSPPPAINPNTNRPLRKVVVQKAADELAASALVSLGVSMAAAGVGAGGPSGGHLNGSGRKGNKFNRAGIKRSVTERERDRGYGDDLGGSFATHGDCNGNGNGGGGGSNLKKKATSTGGNGNGGTSIGNVIANIEYRPEEGGLVAVGAPSTNGKQAGRGGTPQNVLSDSDVTAKVQLLMLMAQNLGEIQNGGAGGGGSAAGGGDGDGDGSGDGGGDGDVVVRAASEGLQGKATAA